MIEKLRVAAQQLLEALLGFAYHGKVARWEKAVNAYYAALAEPKPCQYPECVDNGPDGKCTRWLLAECEKSEDFSRPAQPVQEPVAKCTNSDSWNCKYCRKTESCDALKDTRNFAAPPQRPPLTDEEINDLFSEAVTGDRSAHWLCRAIERKVRGEKE